VVEYKTKRATNSQWVKYINVPPPLMHINEHFHEVLSDEAIIPARFLFILLVLGMINRLQNLLGEGISSPFLLLLSTGLLTLHIIIKSILFPPPSPRHSIYHCMYSSIYNLSSFFSKLSFGPSLNPVSYNPSCVLVLHFLRDIIHSWYYQT
jgi:hypothetical protein